MTAAQPPNDVPRISEMASRPVAQAAVRIFAVALGALLAGYMFLGRGFAHIGVGPVFVGELVLLLAIIALVAARPSIRLDWLHAVLLAFIAWGAIRTIPFLPIYGIDALRDGVLWGYAIFALAVSFLASRATLPQTASWYRRIAPVFVWWVPIAWIFFGFFSATMPRAPGSEIPLLFFKNGDMAVHLLGVAAFMVVGLLAQPGAKLLREMVIATPLLYGLFITGSGSRGAMLSAGTGIGALLLLNARSRHWLSMLFAIPLVAGVMFLNPVDLLRPVLTAAPEPTFIAAPTPVPSLDVRPPSSPTPTPPGRTTSVGQWVENFFSIFGGSDNPYLEGTRAYRLRWWGEIIDYTFFGSHFWLGKGYGINLADADGFQTTADRSLRAPHNSHLTVLARSGVPGFAIWLVLQIGFGVSLLRSALRARSIGRLFLAQAGIWILIYWLVMMVNTSFDPYLEGPQGGIWFWTLFGLGLVTIRLTRDSPDRNHS